MLSAPRVCFGPGNKHPGGLQWKYPHFSSRLGSGCPVMRIKPETVGAPTASFCKIPTQAPREGWDPEWFGARKAAARQKLLRRADTAQRGRKGRFFPGSPRRPCRICCKQGKHRKVDGVRLNLKARICPARTMRSVTNPFQPSPPVSFCASSGLISSRH